MGRKRKEDVGTLDILGEPVNLEKCPECLEHKDCFSCIDGRCTALNENGGQDCAFYKPSAKGIEDCRETYQRLKQVGRSDLIRKYVKAYTVMGFLDGEIDAEEQRGRSLDDYRESDFRAMMKQVPGFD